MVLVFKPAKLNGYPLGKYHAPYCALFKLQMKHSTERTI